MSIYTRTMTSKERQGKSICSVCAHMEIVEECEDRPGGGTIKVPICKVAIQTRFNYVKGEATVDTESARCKSLNKNGDCKLFAEKDHIYDPREIESRNSSCQIYLENTQLHEL